MKRREFIKNTSIVPSALMFTGCKNNVVFDKGEKKMKIFILTGSPRKNGNSNTLADYFSKGATEAGHNVVRFDSAFKNVNPCSACNKCNMDGECVYKDDFQFVKENIIDADCVVFATPMYYFGISAQLKAVIDRFYSINGKISTPKKAVLLMTYADTAKIEAEPIILHYKTLLNYLNWEDSGQIIASGVWSIGSINNTEYPKKAYELGKNI